MAIRKDEIENGVIISKYQDLRFPFNAPPVRGINVEHQLPEVGEK